MMGNGFAISSNTVIFSAAHTWSKSQTFKDGVKLIFGNDADYAIFTDGVTLIIDTDGTAAIAFVDGKWTFAIATTFETAAGDLKFNPAGNNVFERSIVLNDGVALVVGTSGDTIIVHLAAALSADALITSVIEGTANHQGTAVDSLLISNVTDNGDIIILVSDGGNSVEMIRMEGATASLSLGWGALKIGFGADTAAITRPSGLTDVASVITALENLGLVTA